MGLTEAVEDTLLVPMEVTEARAEPVPPLLPVGQGELVPVPRADAVAAVDAVKPSEAVAAEDGERVRVSVTVAEAEPAPGEDVPVGQALTEAEGQNVAVPDTDTVGLLLPGPWLGEEDTERVMVTVPLTEELSDEECVTVTVGVPLEQREAVGVGVAVVVPLLMGQGEGVEEVLKVRSDVQDTLLVGVGVRDVDMEPLSVPLVEPVRLVEPQADREGDTEGEAERLGEPEGEMLMLLVAQLDRLPVPVCETEEPRVGVMLTLEQLLAEGQADTVGEGKEDAVGAAPLALTLLLTLFDPEPHPDTLGEPLTVTDTGGLREGPGLPLPTELTLAEPHTETDIEAVLQVEKEATAVTEARVLSVATGVMELLMVTEGDKEEEAVFPPLTVAGQLFVAQPVEDRLPGTDMVTDTEADIVGLCEGDSVSEGEGVTLVETRKLGLCVGDRVPDTLAAVEAVLAVDAVAVTVEVMVEV